LRISYELHVGRVGDQDRNFRVSGRMEYGSRGVISGIVGLVLSSTSLSVAKGLSYRVDERLKCDNPDQPRSSRAIS
jgi:hypothetical protein